MLGSAAFTTRLALFTLYMNVLLLVNLLRLPFPPFEVSSFEWVAYLVQRMVSLVHMLLGIDFTLWRPLVRIFFVTYQ
jgi:hypothetical protein